MSYRSEDSGFDVQRHILGLVVSVCAAAFVAAAVLAFDAIQYEETFVATVVLPMVFPFFVAVIGIAALFLGSAFTLALARLRLEALWSYGLLGFAGGTLVASFLSSPADNIPDSWSYLLISGGMPGAVWGVAWWLSARRVASRSADA